MNNGKEKIQTFKDLNAWKEGHQLVLGIYKATEKFPKSEQFALVNQLRRAAVSITSNIAEGFSRQSYLEKVQFYSIAQGSNTEVQNQIFIAKDLDFMPEPVFDSLSQKTIVVHKLLNGLIKKSKQLHNS